MRVALRNARVWEGGSLLSRDVVLSGDRVLDVSEVGNAHPVDGEVNLESRVVLPGLVNGHDHLDFSTFPFLGKPPYANVYQWAEAVEGGKSEPIARDALAVPLPDRLFLGGLRNLLAGVTAVAHHNPYHRSLGRDDFPVRVLERYHFAHSPGLTPRLRSTYRTTDRRIPWIVHVAEGTDERSRQELSLLREAGLLRQNTVIIHGIALEPEDMGLIAAARACVVWCPESNRNLYGAAPNVAALLAAGVRVGLGSDSPVSGVRDALSNLATARREGILKDTELLHLATTATAEVARLPVGGIFRGAPADLVVAGSLEELLAGDRGAVDLVMTRGRASYGREDLMGVLAPRAVPCVVEGKRARVLEDLGRRGSALFRAYPQIRRTAWASSVSFD